MNRIPLFSNVRIEYPTIKGLHKLHYVEGVLLEYLDDKTVCVDITRNKEWALSHIKSECVFYKMDPITYWDWERMESTKSNNITITCPAIYVRKPMILITEEYDFKNDTVKIERKEDCSGLRYPNPGGYYFKSSGIYGFLKETFDLLITGQKEEKVYTKGRWKKPVYKSIRYFAPESIEMYNNMLTDSIGIDMSFMNSYYAKREKAWAEFR